jgi:hypothetical protein
VTAAMLLTVSSLLAAGAELHADAMLRKRFVDLHGQVKERISNATRGQMKTAAFWKGVLHDLMYS